MAHEEEVTRLVNESLNIAVTANIRDIQLARHPSRYKNKHSAYVQAQKSLQGAVDLKWLEKGANGHIYYKKPGLKSKHEDHSKQLSNYLTSIICKFPEARISIFREHSIPEISLIPDAICFISHEGRGRCFIFEVCRYETLDYLTGKFNKWTYWNNALPYLSNLLELKIPAFDFVSSKKVDIPGVLHLDDYLKSLK